MFIRSLFMTVLCLTSFFAEAKPVKKELTIKTKKQKKCTKDTSIKADKHKNKHKSSKTKPAHYQDKKSIAPAEQQKKTVEADTKKTAGTQERTVTVNNSIEKKELGYKHWTGTYYPGEFEIKANGVVVAQGAKAAVNIKGNKLVLLYTAEFKQNGRRTARRYTYTLSPATTTVDLHFRWKKDPRVTVSDDNATLESEEVLED